MVRWSRRLTSPGRKHGRRDAVEDALHPSVVEEYFMAGRRTSFRCHHTRAGAPHSRPVPPAPFMRLLRLPVVLVTPFPSTHSTPSYASQSTSTSTSTSTSYASICPVLSLLHHPIQRLGVIVHRALLAYQECPFSWRNGASKVSPPLQIDSVATPRNQRWSLQANSMLVNVG
jgi:hypothetical protein